MHHTSKASLSYIDTIVCNMINTDNNTTKVYYALDEQMVAHHDKDDAQSRRQAEKIAHDLIKHADLPLIIRCRALCVLGCSDEGDYVHHAEQSVHFAKLGLTATQEDGGDDTEGKTILRGCEKGLAAAKAAKAVADAKAATKASTESAEVEVEQNDEQEDGKGDEVAEEEGDEEDEEEVIVIRDAKYEDEEDVDDDEEEVVWHADWDEERKAEAWAAQDRLEAAAADASASTLQTRREEAEEAD
jgi:hypothetical protein